MHTFDLLFFFVCLLWFQIWIWRFEKRIAINKCTRIGWCLYVCHSLRLLSNAIQRITLSQLKSGGKNDLHNSRHVRIIPPPPLPAPSLSLSSVSVFDSLDRKKACRCRIIPQSSLERHDSSGAGCLALSACFPFSTKSLFFFFYLFAFFFSSSFPFPFFFFFYLPFCPSLVATRVTPFKDREGGGYRGEKDRQEWLQREIQ